MASEEISQTEERKRKRKERLQDYDQTPEAARIRQQFSTEEREQDASVEVRVEEKPATEPKPPKVEVQKTNKKAPTKDELATTAPVILNLANTFVVTSFGAECGMTREEANVLGPSLQRCLERMPYGAAKKASVFIDPLVLLIGMAMWGKRIIDIQDRRAKEKYQVKPTDRMRADGASGFTYSVPDEPDSYPPTPVPIYQQPTRATEPQPVSPTFSTANGVPDAIRNAESDYGVPL